MKKYISSTTYLAVAVTLLMAACKKDSSEVQDLTETSLAEEIASTQSIAVAAVSSTSSVSYRASSRDSIYLVNTCHRKSTKDTIVFSSLPTTALTYLTTNYSGYTATRAYVIKDTAGTITGYIAVVQYNAKPVGVLFDANGTFVRVLEQREGRDLSGKGWHSGGVFDGRGGHNRDTLALANLPAAIKTYYATNYATDTLVKAFTNRDSSIIVLSKNNGTFAGVFSATGTFISRAEIFSKRGKSNSIALTALPASAQTYLTTTYPGYVFKHAFSISTNNVVTGYVAVIDANLTKYAVQFSAAGVFVKVVTLR